MSQVLEWVGTGNVQGLVSVDIDIVDVLSDPTRVGEFFLGGENNPTEGNHVATNYGFVDIGGYQTTTHILSPEPDEGYILIQLTDIVLDNPRNSWDRLAVNIGANRLKTAQTMRRYKLDVTFAEMVDLLRQKYRFVKKDPEQILSEWDILTPDVIESRLGNISPEFVDRANQRFFEVTHGYSRKDMQYMKELFSRSLTLR